MRTTQSRLDEIDEELEFIRSELTETDMLMQLAEEAAELSQAALKLARVNEGRNPVSEKYVTKAGAKLKEEYADVILSARALDLHYYDPSQTMAEKCTRWYNRLIHNHDEKLHE